MPSDFAGRVIRWQGAHGRHDLPWQRTRDAYRIWLSEIMLQQTQVSTVIPYYERFLARFPDARLIFLTRVVGVPIRDLADGGTTTHSLRQRRYRAEARLAAAEVA